MANQVDFKILPSDQFNVYSPQTRSEKVITYFTLLSKLRGDILAVSSQDDPNSIVSAYYTNVGNTQTLHLVKADGSEVTASNSFAGTVTSVGVSMPSAFTVTNSPITTSGTIQITGAGTTAQYVRGDGTLATFPSLTGFVPYVGATQNVDLGEYQIKAGQVAFDLTPTGTAGVGIMRWNDQDGTADLGLLGGNVTLQIGQEQVVRVVNKSGINLTEAGYQAVKITGAQGNRLKVGLAQANNDANSADTIGLVTENIALNAEGFVTSSGLVRNIDTTGALQGETWADGDVIYLSPTTAGAVTKVKPTAPQHTVILGFVVRAHQTQGQIYVKVDNGYELEELHDVAPTPYVNNGVLYRDTATNLWKSATIPTVLGYTPANSTTTISTTAPLSGGGDLSANRTLSISQAGASTDGYLSSTDWNTFNSKQGALTFTAPLVNTGGTVTITQAGASANGYLSSTDWNTFNNKASDAFKTIAVTGQSNIVADSPTDTLTFEAGSNIVITTDAANDKITINAIGGGSGSVTSVDMSVPTGFSISGNPITTSGTLALAFASGYSLPTNASQANWDTAYNNSITAFSYNTSTGVLTLTQQDAGTLTATVTLQPFTTDNLTQGSTNLYDKIVSLTGAGTTVVTGTYPNFTITSNDQHVGTVTSIATSAPITGGTITTSGTIGITQSGTAADGYLSSTDWNTFNSKVGGSGTVNYVSKWTSTGAIGNSQIFDSGTYVGINTATPAAKLDISGDHVASIGLLRLNSSASNIAAQTYYIDGVYKAATYAGTDDNFYILGRDADIVFSTTSSTTTRMVITNGGNVGIGTSGPTQKLMVSGSIRVTGGYYDSSNSIGSNGQVLASTGSGTTWINASGGTVNGSGTVNYIPKWTGTTLLADSQLFDNGTNVGVGTATPNRKLTVSGNGTLLGLQSSTAGGYSEMEFTADGVSGAYIFKASSGFSSYAGAGSLNIYNSGAIGFHTASVSNAMFIASATGNIGLGNTGPSQKLHVEGNIRVTGAYYDSANGAGSSGQVLSSTGSGTSWITPFSGSGTTNYVAKWTSGTAIGNSQIFDNGTNVGIGTTAPTAKLHIDSTDDNAYALRVQGNTNNSVGVWTGIGIAGESSNTKTAILFEDIGVSYSRGKMHFALNNAADQTSATPANAVMTLIPDGNVGIGTTAPGYKLDVSAAARVYGVRIGRDFSIANRATVRLDSNGDAPADILFGQTAAANQADWTGVYWSISSRNSGAGAAEGNKFTIWRGDAHSAPNNSESQFITITPGLNLGIGETSPTQKLHVSGNVRVTGAYYDSSNAAGTSGQILSSTGSGTAWIAAPSGGITGSGTTNYVTKWTSGTAVGNSSIYDNGNVGIGTTAPAVPFEIVVNSSVGVTGNVYFLSRFLQDKVNYRGPFFGYDTSGSIAVIGAESAGPASSLAFYTYSGGWGERMRISGTNVGIGTTSPANRLSVSQGGFDNSVTQLSVLNTSVAQKAHVAYDTVLIQQDDAPTLRLHESGENLSTTISSDAGLTSFATTAEMGLFVAGNSTAAGWQGLNGIQAIRIKSNGNVGIGTTAPDAKLHVSGLKSILSNYGVGSSQFFTYEIVTPTSSSTNQTFDMYMGRFGNGYHRVVLWGSGYGTDVGNYFDITRSWGTGSAPRIISNGGLYIGGATYTIHWAAVGNGQYDLFIKWTANMPAGYSNTISYAIQSNTGGGYTQFDYPSGVTVPTLNSSNLVDSVLTAAYNTGNVGIGTTSPDAKLVVTGDSTGTAKIGGISIAGNYTGISLNGTLSLSHYNLLSAPNDASLFINRPTGNAIRFRESNSEQVTIATGGNVGIGTTAPDSALEINGRVSIRNANELYFGQSTSAIGSWTTRMYASGSTHYFNANQFIFNNSGYGLTEFLRITPTGNVGIGETAPSQKLHVSGNIRVTGAYYDSANSAGTSGQILSSTGTGTAWIAAPSGGGVSGSGTTNYVTKWTSGSAVGNSQIFDNGTNVGVATADPIASLDNQGSYGTYRQRGLTTMVTNNLGAAGTQAKRFEIARASIDYNDWNTTGPIEVELYERYYSRGLKKKYVIYYGYVSSSGCNLVEMTGSGDNQFMVSIGPEVVISGDNRYIPIYVDVRYYSQVTAVVKTNRELTLTNPPGNGSIWMNNMPTGVDISDFTPDSTVYVGNIIGGNSTFATGNVGVGTITPDNKLTVKGTNALVDVQSDADGQTVGLLARYLNNNALGAGFRYTTGDAQLYIDNFYPGNNGVYSDITIRNCDTGGTLQPRIKIKGSSGNVGIGTTEPLAKLHVIGSIDTRTNNSVTDTSIVLFNVYNGPPAGDGTTIGTGITWKPLYDGYSKRSAGIMQIAEGNYFRAGLAFYTNGVQNDSTDWSERLRISSNGNVGIGTTAPGAKLQINDGTGSAEFLRLSVAYDTSRSARGGIYWHDTSNTTGRIYTEYDGTMTSMVFGSLYNSGYNSNNLMIIRGNGNVGIGTTSPNKQLTFAQANDDAIQIRRLTTSQGNTSLGTGISWTWTSAGTDNETWAAIRVIMPGNGNTNMTFSTTPVNGGGAGLTERMRIADNGNVGIGTTSPSYRLVVNKVSTAAPAIMVGGAFYGGPRIQTYGLDADPNAWMGLGTDMGVGSYEHSIYYSAYNNYGKLTFGTYDGTTYSTKMLLNASGNLGIGTTSPAYKLDVSGTIRATGDVIAYSDARVKENVETLDGALDKVMKMRGVSYNKIGEQEKKVGVIAQEILEVLPEVVSQDETGTYSVAYGNIVSVLIEAIKEQQKQIDELKAKLK